MKNAVIRLLATTALVAGTIAPIHSAMAEVDKDFFQAIEFRNLGPFRGGRSTAIAGVQGDALTYYYGATGGGVWKTSNGGHSWFNVSDKDFGLGSIGAIAVAPNDSNVVYVGTGTADVRGVSSSHGDGVYKSTDGGKTWQNMGLPHSRQIASIVVSPTDPDTVFVGVQGASWGDSEERGVYKSTDGGHTWRKVLYVNNATGATDLKMDDRNPRVLYASMWDHQRTPYEIRSGGGEEGSGIYKSVDGGESWIKLDKGLPEKVGKIGVAPSPANPDRVFAIVEAKEKGGLYRSEDGGENWSLISENRLLHARSWYYMHITADPQDENTVYVDNSGFYKSIDGGKSFSSIRTPHGDHHELWINPDNPKNMVQANDGGGTVTFDGGQTWSQENNQPTTQIYRLTVDNGFPYRLYGGQQDNTSVGIRSRGLDGSIGHEDFQSYGGCESAFVAMDPNATNPRYFYSGCYLGQIEEYDAVTQETRDVRVYPELAFGVAPKDRKFRFNWNAPILVSAHDSQTIYHAGNMLFKSTDRGTSWTAISPDLTRDEKNKQGPGGRPITNEVSENYNTIAYVAESQHDKNVIYTGADDGLVHVTKDGGQSWANVTPKTVKDGIVKTIEISPHDAATAYATVTRHKYDDHTPYLYKTTNYGKSWTKITKGMIDGDVVRVVREDTVRKNLLFAGTERGVYVSFNGGKEWQELKLNLPRVPVTDMKIKGHDLAIATQGRGFWIADNITPLRTLTEDLEKEALHLFQPTDAFDFITGGRAIRGNAKNPDNGAWFYYSLAEDVKELTLDILDSDGALIRTLDHSKKKGAIGTKKGLNRVVWNLRDEGLTKIDGVFALGGRGGQVPGYEVPPGQYTVRMTLGDTVVEKPFNVVLDPRSTETMDNIAIQQGMLKEIKTNLEELHQAVNSLRDVRSQVNDLMKRITDAPEELKTASKTLNDAIDAWEDDAISPKRTFFQDVLNWPDKLDSDMQELYGTIAYQVTPVTKGMMDRNMDLVARFDDVIKRHDAIKNNQLPAFLDAYQGAGFGPIVVKPVDVAR